MLLSRVIPTSGALDLPVSSVKDSGLASIYSLFLAASVFPELTIAMRGHLHNLSWSNIPVQRLPTSPFPFTAICLWNTCLHFLPSPLFWTQSNQIFVPTSPLKQLLSKALLSCILLGSISNFKFHLPLSHTTDAQHFYLLPEIFSLLAEPHFLLLS